MSFSIFYPMFRSDYPYERVYPAQLALMAGVAWPVVAMFALTHFAVSNLPIVKK